MKHRAIISNCATDWAGTWLVVDEKYNTISKHGSRKAAEEKAERLNQADGGMAELQEAVNLNTAILANVIRLFRVTMGGKYGRVTENPDVATMLRAIMFDIEKVNDNLKEANNAYNNT